MRVKKVDANQKQIVDMVRKIPGVSIVSIHTVGNGVPDLILGCKGKNFLLELKDGNKTKSQKKLTPDELEFHDKWKGQVCIVECFEDVLKIIQAA